MPYLDKAKQRKSQRKHYASHQKVELAKRMRRKKEIRDWFQALKEEQVCSRCGENETCCLEYHHRNPSKKIKHVANMIRDGNGKMSILVEIEKCDLVCANCHRKIHASVV